MVALQCTVPNSLYLTLELREVAFTKPSHEGQVKRGRWLRLFFFFFFFYCSEYLACLQSGRP